MLQVVYRQYEFVLNLNMDSQDTCKDKKFLKINLSLDKLKKKSFWSKWVIITKRKEYLYWGGEII